MRGGKGKSGKRIKLGGLGNSRRTFEGGLELEGKE